jgi:3-dehydro-L-gulonate 2-dehydrogenase
MLISYSELFETFKSILISRGFTPDRAALSSKLFSDASLDGVYSHGANRFPAHVADIDDGIIKPNAVPVKTGGSNSMERWDGKLGPGNLNAWFCMERAIILANEHEIGCVALKNTNHWLRAGNYGWHAAEKACIGICFTNTIPNMPPWGGKEARIGNNPIVIAIPGENGNHLVLDMATSQYAYGKLNLFAMDNRQLPYPGGFDIKGELTTDPSAILETQRVLPVGLWKGSGLTMMLDLLAAGLSGGDTTKDIGEHGREYGLSQVFIAFKPTYDHAEEFMNNKRNELIDYIKTSQPAFPGSEILYPGERTLKTRLNNSKNGIPVNDNVWNSIQGLQL